jgi:ABC-type transport system involved in multi-copper enzyme maturation permease subunit
VFASVFPIAVLVQEREPLTLNDLPNLVVSWVQDVGGFAMVGLAVWYYFALLGRMKSPPRGRGIISTYLGKWLWSLAQMRQPETSGEKWPTWMRYSFHMASAVAAATYTGLAGAWLLNLLQAVELGTAPAALNPSLDFLYTLGGGCAIFAVLLPFLRDLVRWRWQRIWAIARLSATEVWRRKIYLVLVALLAVVLVADWFMPYKAEDQLRNYVELVYWCLIVLLALTMAVVSSFGIPSDVRHQTIHTIVTKPVERFEIVLGRFVGYTFVMSATLLVLTLLSLLWLSSLGVHPEAEFETYRARVPLFGDLGFRGRQPDFRGEMVGREWEYRRYIAGGPNSSQRAVWDFRSLPTRLDERPDVPCEFAFDIFRTRRPEREGQGVSCTFAFVTRAWHPARLADYQRDRKQLEERNPPPSEAEVAEALAARYGYFEYRSKEIHDYHTVGFRVPVGLFKNAREAAPKADDLPVVRVEVKCETPSQFIGVAKRDLYLLDAEGYFGLNYIKGAAGLWFRLCLIIGLAVACSTYLSGVISLISALFFFLLGLIRPFVEQLAAGQTEGGGPAEAFHRLVTNTNLVTPLDRTPTVEVATRFDMGFRWFLQRFLNVIPNVNYYSLTDYVASGFDISMVELGLRALVLFGYLLPWAVVAYYLMKSREVAS